MDVRLLIEQYTSTGLTLLSPTLYELSSDRKIAYFHDDERSDLFFIRLNEFLNTQFHSPIDQNKKLSLFTLMEEFCFQYQENETFNKFLKISQETKEFFFKKRYYKYYISPFDIAFEISIAELVNFQSNYSKHSYYHLTNIKEKLKRHFKKNDIPNFENEDYNEHLAYFKEAVLDDRLNYNQTKIIQQLGELFLAFWDLLNSNEKERIDKIINEHISKNGKGSKWNFEKPTDLNKIEEFFWIIKGRFKYDRKRIEKFVPETWKHLIEKETSKENMIEKNR